MASPLQEFQNKSRERWKVMHDVPPWSVDSIVRYITLIFFSVENDNVIQTIQRRMRIMLPEYCPVDYDDRYNFLRSLKDDSSNGSEKIVLPLLDIVVKYIRDYAPNRLWVKDGYDRRYLHDYDMLNNIDDLLSNGSKWKVLRSRNSDSGLIERVNPEITKIAQNLDNDFLIKAWNQAFQRQPDPENAVVSAQKAIENIASNLGLTKATSKVYGTLLGDIKANPHLYFSRARDAYDLQNIITKQPKDKLNVNEQFANWFWSGMDLIQKTNPGRHPSKEVGEFSLSAEAAQQAVIIATMICWFIESGSFFKDDVSKKQSK
jgi:hypothetical protein